ncbi:protein Bouncer-like [Vanacampus margaritifer]
MAAQRKQRLTLTSILLTVVLLLSSLARLESLLCYVCPLQDKESPCPNMTTECPSGQRCVTSRGYYGTFHALSAQGCVDASLCGSRPAVSYMGVEYRVRHSCCCKDKCNMAPTSQDILKMLLGVMAEKNGNATRALREKLWGSCGGDPVASTEPSPSVL